MDLLIIINFNEKEYNSKVSTLTNTIGYMKEIIQIFNSITEIGNFETEDFKGLFFHTENFLFERIMKGKPTEFAGMKINKQKFFNDYMEKPKGYYDVLKQIEFFNKRTTQTLGHSWHGESLKNYLNFFVLLPNGDFEIKQEILDNLKRENETYINSEKAKLAYKFAIALKELVNEKGFLKNLGIVNQQAFDGFIRAILPINSDKPEINILYIEHLDSSR